jgi:hypothetical protein
MLSLEVGFGRRRRCFRPMTRPFLVAIVGFVLAATPLYAGEPTNFVTGKLVDLRREGTGAGAARAQGSFCLAVEVGDLTYLVSHEAVWRWSYEPTDFIVGDSVEVRIKGKDLYIKKAKGGDLKTYITRRERNTPDRKPLTCALAVQDQR